jgi:hypothetical protein
MIGIIASSAGRLPQNFYIASTGNDSNAGTIGSPWLTIAKVNAATLIPGDQVLFNGGDTFSGSLLIETSGESGSPIIVSSYGTGRATISAGNAGNGIEVFNAVYVTVEDINVTGGGPENNFYVGVQFHTNTTNRYPGAVVTNVNASGFGNRGIGIMIDAVEDALNSAGGYDAPQITYCNVTNNGIAGIFISGDWHYGDLIPVNSEYGYLNHTDCYIAHCYAYDNPGKSQYLTNWSGTGILMSGTNGGTIEHCTAYSNGSTIGSGTGANTGSIGIWMAECDDVIIQYCESYGNTAWGVDGGGFDMDGSVHRGIIQYCYSHDNKGNGFFCYEWGSARGCVDNIIRYCISENDGTDSDHAAFCISGGNNTATTGTKMYNNVGYIRNGYPAIKTWKNTSNTQIKNNIFYFPSANNMFSGDDADAFTLDNNMYYVADGSTLSFRYNAVDYAGLVAFKTASAQEANGIYANPRFTSPGAGTNIGFGNPLSGLTSYKLLAGSPAINTGAVITGAPATDFWSNNLIGSVNIGVEDDAAVSATYTPADSDASAYLIAAGLSSERDKQMVDEFYAQVKADGVYTKLHAFYLFMGGSAASSKWNGKNPLDTDAAFRMVFTNSPTFNNRGITLNSSGGLNQIADTKYRPYYDGQTTSNGHFSTYLQTGVTGSHFTVSTYHDNFILGYPEWDLGLNYTGGTDLMWMGAEPYATVPTSGNTGYVVVNRPNGTNTQAYQNGVKKLDAAQSYTTAMSNYIRYGQTTGNNNSHVSYFHARISFASLGLGLTDAEAINLSKAVNHLMKKRGIETY